MSSQPIVALCGAGRRKVAGQQHVPAIATPCLAYHEHNKLARLDEVLTALAGGDVALVSDAGTPAMSDPGFELANTCIAAALEDMLKILDDRRPTTDEN